MTVRENTEGEYSGLEHEVTPGVVENIKARRDVEFTGHSIIVSDASCHPASTAADYTPDAGYVCLCRCPSLSLSHTHSLSIGAQVITRAASERIANYAFAYARYHGRKRVTVVHKADLMKLVDGLFLECCQEAAAAYPDIQFEEMLIDNAMLKVGSALAFV